MAMQGVDGQAVESGDLSGLNPSRFMPVSTITSQARSGRYLLPARDLLDRIEAGPRAKRVQRCLVVRPDAVEHDQARAFGQIAQSASASAQVETKKSRQPASSRAVDCLPRAQAVAVGLDRSARGRRPPVRPASASSPGSRTVDGQAQRAVHEPGRNPPYPPRRELRLGLLPVATVELLDCKVEPAGPRQLALTLHASRMASAAGRSSSRRNSGRRDAPADRMPKR